MHCHPHSIKSDWLFFCFLNMTLTVQKNEKAATLGIDANLPTLFSKRGFQNLSSQAEDRIA